MTRYVVPQLADGVYAVGSRDNDRRMFDALIPLPHGTTYNSYVVVGKKTALIDTVNPGFEMELIAKLHQLVEVADIDYIVMNHAEPDHAGSIPAVMAAAPRAVLVASEKGAEMARIYYGVPEERMRRVKEGDTIDLGGKTLRFIDAPFLHWPETMFTYLVEDGMLFSCDFFGAHTAYGICDEDVDDILGLARSYFGEIMMPFRTPGKKALDKLATLDIKVIAPSHGPVYKNPQKILGAYREWTAGATAEKAIIAYVSMWGSTAAMVRTMAEELVNAGIDVKLHNLALVDLGALAADLVDSRAVVLGTPTVLGGMHPLALHAVNLIKALRPPLKYGAVLSSFGWNGGALKSAAELLGPTGMQVAGAVEIRGPPTEKDHIAVAELARKLAGMIRGNG